MTYITRTAELVVGTVTLKPSCPSALYIPLYVPVAAKDQVSKRPSAARTITIDPKVAGDGNYVGL